MNRGSFLMEKTGTVYFVYLPHCRRHEMTFAVV